MYSGLHNYVSASTQNSSENSILIYLLPFIKGTLKMLRKQKIIFRDQFLPATVVKMKLASINVSLANFQMPNVELWYLDPYNNTLGENNWIIICLAIIPCICSICAIYVVGLVSIEAFVRITVLMVTIEAYFVWYMTEKVFKGQCEMDAVGMAECIKFFTVSISAGLTFLISSVGYKYHQLLIRYTGLPLDFNEKYLIDTR